MKVEVFCVACADLEAMRKRAASLVTPVRRLKMEQLLLPSEQLGCLGAGLLLHHVLGVREDSQLVYGGYGKPYLAQQGAPGFSLAHAGDFALLAVGPPVLGVDIEPWTLAQWSHDGSKEGQLDTRFVHEWMTEQEQELWLGSSEPDEVFLRIWTGKESMLKATGQGFHFDPASFSILPLTDGQRVFQDQDWTVLWRTLEKHQLAVATPSHISSLEITVIPAKDLVL